MNIKAIALITILGLATPAIADVALNTKTASAMPTDFNRPTGAFMNGSQQWVVWLKLDEFGAYTYQGLNRKNGSSLELKNPTISGNKQRYSYTFRNNNYKYIIAHQPKDPDFIRLTVVNPQGLTVLNELMEYRGQDWDV